MIELAVIAVRLPLRLTFRERQVLLCERLSARIWVSRQALWLATLGAAVACLTDVCVSIDLMLEPVRGVLRSSSLCSTRSLRRARAKRGK